MPSQKEIKSLFEKFTHMQVMIIGDVMTDKYVYGDVERISPEAPVPIVSVSHIENRPGGAANVAMNIKSLGATPLLFTIIGDDDEGSEFISLLEKNHISTTYVMKREDRSTTMKTRVIAKNHQMLRYDREMTENISAEIEEEFLTQIKNAINAVHPDVLIFEDYNKGILTEKIIRETTIKCLNQHIPVAVDPKKNNFFSYQLCTLFKPNLRELRDSLHMEFEPDDIKALQEASVLLHKQLHNAMTLVTLGDKGIYLHTGDEIVQSPAQIRNVADVSGAGDTVISVASLCLAAKTNLQSLALLSNIAGGLVCEYPGVVPVNKKQLLEEAEKIWK